MDARTRDALIGEKLRRHEAMQAHGKSAADKSNSSETKLGKAVQPDVNLADERADDWRRER